MEAPTLTNYMEICDTKTITQSPNRSNPTLIHKEIDLHSCCDEITENLDTNHELTRQSQDIADILQTLDDNDDLSSVSSRSPDSDDEFLAEVGEIKIPGTLNCPATASELAMSCDYDDDDVNFQNSELKLPNNWEFYKRNRFDLVYKKMLNEARNKIKNSESSNKTLVNNNVSNFKEITINNNELSYNKNKSQILNNESLNSKLNLEKPYNNQIPLSYTPESLSDDDDSIIPKVEGIYSNTSFYNVNLESDSNDSDDMKEMKRIMSSIVGSGKH